MEPIRRVDVDEDHAELRRGELDERPLGVVRTPHADTVTHLEPERQEPAGDVVHRIVELRVREAEPLMAADERVRVRERCHRPFEVRADGLTE